MSNVRQLPTVSYNRRFQEVEEMTIEALLTWLDQAVEQAERELRVEQTRFELIDRKRADVAPRLFR